MTSSSEEAVQRTLYGVPTQLVGHIQTLGTTIFIHLKIVNVRCGHLSKSKGYKNKGFTFPFHLSIFAKNFHCFFFVIAEKTSIAKLQKS